MTDLLKEYDVADEMLDEDVELESQLTALLKQTRSSFLVVSDSKTMINQLEQSEAEYAAEITMTS